MVDYVHGREGEAVGYPSLPMLSLTSRQMIPSAFAVLSIWWAR